LFEMSYILELWLKVVPEGSAMYGRLIIILVLVVLLSSGMQNVFVAIGKVKTYNIYVSLFLILNLPISYVLFKYGFASYTIIIVGIVLELITLNVRLILLKKYLDYKISTYFTEIAQITLPTFLVSGILFLLMYVELPSFLHLVISFAISILLSPILIYKFSLDSFQKQYVLNMISKFKPKR
jgi:hypothetical protein